MNLQHEPDGNGSSSLELAPAPGKIDLRLMVLEKDWFLVPGQLHWTLPHGSQSPAIWSKV